MAAQDFNSTAPFGAIAIHNTISAIENSATRFKLWNDRRKTVAALSKLSTHELEDIGLYPSDISEMAARFSTQR